MKKVTAIDWLLEQLKINNYISDNAHWLIDDAIEMEKQQIMNAHEQGYSDGYKDNGNMPIDYYHETYNK